jgi:hypothetical protein
MPSPSNEPDHPANACVDGEHSQEDAAQVTGAGPLTADQMARWAKLIADGEVDLPDDLDPKQTEQLLTMVQLRRRARLVRWIAHAIAQDLLDDGGKTEEARDD